MWKGADCSQEAFIANGPGLNYTATIHGNMWAYVQHESNVDNWELIIRRIKNNFPYTIYISEGKDSDPNPFNFDMKLKPRGMSVALTRDIVGYNNFVIAVYIEAYTEISNEDHVEAIEFMTILRSNKKGFLNY